MDDLYNSTRAFRIPVPFHDAQTSALIMLDGKKSVLVINGPNLNLLGIREPHSQSHLTPAYCWVLTGTSLWSRNP